MKRGTRQGGFSLVEVSLALLVVGVGIMAVFALFPSGLDAARLSQEETRAVLFANDTFDLYRTLYRPNTGVPMTNLPGLDPTPYGNDFLDGSVTLPPRVTDTNWPGSGIATIVFQGSTDDDRYAAGWRFGLTGGIRDHVLRYRLVIADHPDVPRVKRALLLVWPGEFGPATTNNAYRFYTEFY